jgi:hypothetical protein
MSAVQNLGNNNLAVPAKAGNETRIFMEAEKMQDSRYRIIKQRLVS